MARSDRYTIETGKKEFFSDFLTNLDKNPVTGYLAKATNDEAIQQSIKNLLLTNTGDWPFESSVGSKIKSSLFDLNDHRLYDDLENSVREAIRNHEPRVEVLNVLIDTDQNSYEAYISIAYEILNIPDETFNFTVVVNRVR